MLLINSYYVYIDLIRNPGHCPDCFGGGGGGGLRAVLRLSLAWGCCPHRGRYYPLLAEACCGILDRMIYVCRGGVVWCVAWREKLRSTRTIIVAEHSSEPKLISFLPANRCAGRGERAGVTFRAERARSPPPGRHAATKENCSLCVFESGSTPRKGLTNQRAINTHAINTHALFHRCDPCDQIGSLIIIGCRFDRKDRIDFICGRRRV